MSRVQQTASFWCVSLQYTRLACRDSGRWNRGPRMIVKNSAVSFRKLGLATNTLTAD